ncbi:unnamed protein product [Cyclocybe aegerita]|uniref:Uncharacterized protein n=1 Tax=Cyclocybe aegerita TaxID=1973307 RepID=A0A8S0VWE0_CYCAE|nr:unnamed protein product [Cyclocybe aegerita]
MASTTQSILRQGLTSPARAFIQKPQTTRSILKRPTALPLSPSGASAAFSVLLSPTGGLKSPHVHFPPSPSKLAATFVTHSPGSYDRAPIAVSPNPLALPSWGDRIYSPSIEGFRLSAPPRPFRSLSFAYQASPVITDFEDPRSPKAQPAADVTHDRVANAVRFEQLTELTGPARPSRDLRDSLASYPRSPYPSAPIEYTEQDVSVTVPEPAVVETRGRQLHRNDVLPSPSARVRARAQSMEVRNKKGLSLSGPTNHASLNFKPMPSPLAQFTTSSTTPAPLHTSSLNRAHKPAPLALNASPSSSDGGLAQAFWQSVSLDASTSGSASLSAADEPMVTALEYPESATDYDEMLDLELRSAAQPPLMFAGADGVVGAVSSPAVFSPAPFSPSVVFSPGLPKPRAALDRLHQSLSSLSALASPSVKRTSFAPLVRREITAPSPNDPFAAFPSFGAAIEMGVAEGRIQYPPRVVLERA